MKGTHKLDDYPFAIRYSSDELWISDWLQGFDANLESTALTAAVNFAKDNSIGRIYTAFVFDERIRRRYPDIEFRYDQRLYNGHGWENMRTINTHPTLDFENFLCSFNGSGEVGRQLLVAVLAKNGWFDPACCTKNFECSNDRIDGHIQRLSTNPDLHRKFFCDSAMEDFFASKVSIDYNKSDHVANFYSLASIISKSFVNLVAEVDSAGYYPIHSEKFLHSVVSRGLFLSFAPPHWHKHFELMFGFQNYDKIFTYEFDDIENPIDRLLKIISMLGPYSKLKKQDWHDLYLLNHDVIEHNYDHYFSGNHLISIEQYESNFITTPKDHTASD